MIQLDNISITYFLSDNCLIVDSRVCEYFNFLVFQVFDEQVVVRLVLGGYVLDMVHELDHSTGEDL
jgi:hypothetical protein